MSDEHCVHQENKPTGESWLRPGADGNAGCIACGSVFVLSDMSKKPGNGDTSAERVEALEAKCALLAASWKKAEEELERVKAERDQARAVVRQLVGALEVVLDWIPDTDHHESDCPGDCDGHASKWTINKALASARALLGTGEGG